MSSKPVSKLDIPDVGNTGHFIAPDALTREQDHLRMLRTLFATLDGIVYRCRDNQHSTLEFASQGSVKITGYDPSDLTLNRRVSWESLKHPDDQLWVQESIRNAVDERQTYDLEYRILHADGSVRWVWDRGVGVYDTRGRVLALEGIIHDITRHKHTEQELREAQRRYRGLFDHALEGIFRTTMEGRYLGANPALANIYGFESPEELMATLHNISSQLYVNPGRRAEFMRIITARGSVSGFESQVYRKNGEIIWISENARAIFDEHGALQGYEGTVEDITDRRLYQSRIEQQANFDTLTGLANRALLQDCLSRAVLTAAGDGNGLSVVFIDLDRFKFINDSLGHQVGDRLLATMAGRLRSCVQEGDTVARLGGDEFVLLARPDGAQARRALLERILATITEPWKTEHGEFQITCSIGVAVYPDDGRDAQTLLKHADTAMYRAKDCGRNNFQFFTTELNCVMTERLEVEAKLRRALEHDHFQLYYQPRIDLASGRMMGAEALLRLCVPGEPVTLPQRFIPVAEDTGLINPIGRWVLQSACARNKAWQAMGLPPMVVSVNVSARQFRTANFVRTIADILQATGLEPRYLELELTESVMHDAPELVSMLAELKSLGVQVAIDDFGTGYSSLSSLKRLPVDRLKVDRSFIEQVATDKDDAAIVRTIITLGRNLGLKILAEGVETAQQMQFLRQHGCDEVQGYFFGRPVPVPEFEALLQDAAG